MKSDKKKLLFYCKNSSLKKKKILSFASYYFWSSYCHLSSIYTSITHEIRYKKKKLILLIFNLFHCLFKIISSACLGVIAELDIAKCSMQCWSYVDRLYMLSNWEQCSFIIVAFAFVYAYFCALITLGTWSFSALFKSCNMRGALDLFICEEYFTFQLWPIYLWNLLGLMCL